MTAILPPPSPPLTTGMTIDRAGKYRLGELLGEGGMARVYRGAIISDEGFHREVAIKVVLPAFSADAYFFEMFRQEARLASLLHHDNIVAALDFDRGVDGNVFQILEYVRGRDLEKLARTGPIPMPVAAYIIGEVLRGGSAMPTRRPMRRVRFSSSSIGIARRRTCSSHMTDE